MKCVCVWRGAGGFVDEMIRFGFYQSCRNKGRMGHVPGVWVVVVLDF